MALRTRDFNYIGIAQLLYHCNISMDSGLEIDYGTKKSFRRRLTDGCEPDSNTIVARIALDVSLLQVKTSKQ